MKKFLFYISQTYSFAIIRPIQEILLARGDEVRWFIEGNDVGPFPDRQETEAALLEYLRKIAISDQQIQA